MSYRRNLSRLAVASLLVAAVSVPAASAMPIDPVTTTTDPAASVNEATGATPHIPAAQLDMHTSTVHKPAPQGLDARSENAKDPIAPQTKKPVVDARSENAKDPIAPETRKPVVVPSRRPLPGPPTWPEHPQVLVPPKQTVTTTTDGGGGDIEWPIAAIALAGALLIGGGLGAAGYRHRVTARPAH